MLQDRLNNIKDYFLTMECIEGKWFVSVKYKPKWGAYSSGDGRIQAVPDEKTPCVYWYYSNDEDQNVEYILDLIEETIQTNLDAIKKVDLFKEKVAELQKLFSDESLTYRQLETLRFEYDEEEPIVPKLPTALKSVAKAAKKQTKKTTKQPKTKDTNKIEKQEKVYEVKSDSASVSVTSNVEMPNDITTTQADTAKMVDNVEVVTPINMTKEEIDMLRG